MLGTSSVVDPRWDWRQPFCSFRVGLLRAIGFELAASLAYECPTAEETQLVRWQHQQNGDLLLGILEPGRN